MNSKLPFRMTASSRIARLFRRGTVARLACAAVVTFGISACSSVVTVVPPLDDAAEDDDAGSSYGQGGATTTSTSSGEGGATTGGIVDPPPPLCDMPGSCIEELCEVSEVANNECVWACELEALCDEVQFQSSQDATGLTVELLTPQAYACAIDVLSYESDATIRWKHNSSSATNGGERRGVIHKTGGVLLVSHAAFITSPPAAPFGTLMGPLPAPSAEDLADCAATTDNAMRVDCLAQFGNQCSP